MGTILITGGHHNSALVVAKEFLRLGQKVVWIGHRHSSRGDRSDSAEYIEVTQSKIPFYDLQAGKLTPRLTEIIRLPYGIIQSLVLLKKIRPTAILSFGGYLGGTVAFAAYILGIPISLHEQTVIAGKANKLIGKLAKYVYLTWGESAKYFKAKNSKIVGLPLRQSILKPQKKSFFTRRKPTLLVMGGKQGAHQINEFIFGHLSDLLTHFNIIHQTGTSSLTHDYERALALDNNLGSLSDCYLPIGYIGESEIGTYLASSDLYFGRSGAHIVYELAIMQLPAILVPLMTTHDREQYKNAQILLPTGCTKIIVGSDLSLSSFMKSLASIKSSKYHRLSLPMDATKQLTTHFISHL